MSDRKPQPAPDAQNFRRTMGLFATGVAVLTTCQEDGECIAMTANAIASVSLDPLLVLVCVTKTANIAPHLLREPGFALSFLHEDQQPLSSFFAGLWPADQSPPPFEFEPWEGGPRLIGSIGAVGCRRYAVHDGGDHWIVVGEVTALHQAGHLGSPLIFFGGRYRQLAAAQE